MEYELLKGHKNQTLTEMSQPRSQRLGFESFIRDARSSGSVNGVSS